MGFLHINSGLIGSIPEQDLSFPVELSEKMMS